MYTMTLSDGTQLKNLKLNGNNWITSEVITENTFSGKLNRVSVTDGKTTQEYTDQTLVQIQQYGNEYWFILGEQTQDEKINQSITELQVAFAEVYEMMIGGQNNG